MLDRDDALRVVRAALAEDVGRGDVTSAAVLPAEARLTATMTARQAMVVCGLPVAALAFAEVDPAIVFTPLTADGATVEAGADLARIDGPARAVLTAERTALNLMQVLSGIATLTTAYVRAIDGTGAVLLDTRKTIPGLRLLSKYATVIGGGRNHRLRLDDGVLIKDNHIAAAGSVRVAVERAVAAGLTDIEVECDTLAQAEEAIAAGARRLLLDNFAPAALAEAVAHLRAACPAPLILEASGGVTLATIRALAESGVDFISTSRPAMAAPAVDIGLDYSLPSVSSKMRR